MSQGAIFSLVLNDARFDKYITATDYLSSRIKTLRFTRKSQCKANTVPTFAELGQSHILYVKSTYKPYAAVASEYSKVQASTINNKLTSAGGDLEFTFPINGNFTSDMAFHVNFSALGSATAEEATAETPYYRYCAFPGARLFSKVELRSKQFLIDDYGSNDVMERRKFFVSSDNLTNWDRCHGQQETREASYFGNGYTGVLNYCDGPQTPKLYQEGFDMFIPAQFWFCQDPSQSLHNDMIPNTQRTIMCKLESFSRMVQALIPDPENPGSLMEVAPPVNSVKFTVDLYVNNLYINKDINNIFASRVGFSLIRTHRRQVSQLKSASGSILLDQLKFPAEYFTIGVRTRRLVNDFDRWWMMGYVKTRADAAKLIVPTMVWNSELRLYQLVYREAGEVTSLENMVDTIGVTSQNIDLYPMIQSEFYNSYLPNRYPVNSMTVSPTDTASFLINFCLFPGQYNPSGYFNLSAGRNTYIKYALKSTAPDVSREHTEMITSMSAINFIIKSGDDIKLKYSI